MKVKEFLKDLDSSIFSKINTLSEELNKTRVYKKYQNFEDIVYGEMIKQISFFIKPSYKKIPAYMLKPSYKE